MTIIQARPAGLRQSITRGLSHWVTWLLTSAALALPGWWWLRHQRSAAVRIWSHGGGDVMTAGPLRVRVFGTGEDVILLLHGIIASSDCFGSAYDELGRSARVVVPDLLGFGASMDAAGPYDAVAHIHALDAALDELGLSRRRTMVVGHSMGGALAIRWAAAHSDRTQAVLTFGAPLYRTRAEADQRIGAMGPMAGLLAGTGRVSRAVCAWSCRHRGIASWLAAGSRPELPVSVARGGVNHTWASYSDSLDGLVRDDGWVAALIALNERSIRIVLADGALDPVPVHGLADVLAGQFSNVRHDVHLYADHLLPLSDPGWCRTLIDQVASSDKVRGTRIRHAGK